MKKLYVIGLGPGETDSITQRAKNAIEESGVIVGYDLYVKQIASLTEGKRVVSTPMRREAERCRIAVEVAAGGETTAMVCTRYLRVCTGWRGLCWKLPNNPIRKLR